MAFIKQVVIPTFDNHTEEDTLLKLHKIYDRPIYGIDNACVSGGGICQKYNTAISHILSLEPVNESEWIVFQHNDAVPISNISQIENKLDEAREKGASVVGVAGSLIVPPVSPGFWWHGLGTPQFRGAGAVQHPMRDMSKPNELVVNDKFLMSFYGPYPQRVAAIDGLWMAINAADLAKYHDLRFDATTFDTDYHYYDADFCATVRKLKLQMWIMGVIMHHNSPGISMLSTGFLLAQKKFMSKWWKNQAEYAQYDT